jgi:hypothetical protein
VKNGLTRCSREEYRLYVFKSQFYGDYSKNGGLGEYRKIHYDKLHETRNVNLISLEY